MWLESCNLEKSFKLVLVIFCVPFIRGIFTEANKELKMLSDLE